MNDYLSTPDLAKHLRKILKANFPAQKFSVRSNSYSGGSSIDIGWKDGPTAGAVEKIVKGFQGSTFDGMTDMKSSRNVTLQGKKIYTDYIFCHRTKSAAFLQKVVAAVGAKYGIPQAEWPAVIASEHDAYLEHTAGNRSVMANITGWDYHWSWSCVVNRAAGDASTVAMEEVAA